jgi:hypothetical protein
VPVVAIVAIVAMSVAGRGVILVPLRLLLRAVVAMAMRLPRWAVYLVLGGVTGRDVRLVLAG